MADKVICRFHASTGGCRNGINCRFSHDLSNVPSQVCLYFMAGHCAFGSRCRYAHVLPDGTALDNEQQPSQSSGTQRQGLPNAQQLQDPSQSTQDLQAREDAGKACAWQISGGVMSSGCADAAWEDEGPGSSSARPSLTAETAIYEQGASSHSFESKSGQGPTRNPIARPRPLSRSFAAQQDSAPQSDSQELSQAQGSLSASHQQANGSDSKAELFPKQNAWTNGQYAHDEHAEGSSHAAYGTYGGAYDNDDEWGEQGAHAFEQYLAENKFEFDAEGWVQYAMDNVLPQDVKKQLERATDEHGHTADDHGYGGGKHGSFDCESNPDDFSEFPDEDYQKWLEDDVEHYGEGEPEVHERELRQPPYLDPDSALEQLMRNEGGPEHAVPSSDGRFIRSWQSASEQCSSAAGRKTVTQHYTMMRASAPTWAPASEHGSLPASSASVQQEGDLCAQYRRNGTCSNGASCERLHGIYCKNCQRFVLHPSDAHQRSEHAADCLARHKRVSSHAASRLIECSVCMELVLSKPDPSERKFGLLDCNHAFCLSCIRDWRSRTESGADVETAVRACPVCRQVTHYVTPSLVWPADEDEKEAIMGAYRNKLGSIDCRFFDFGNGTCPFSTSCMYRHAYKNGQLEERKFRKRMDADGEVGGMRDSRLSDFLDASLRSQQAVRRAMRGTATAR